MHTDSWLVVFNASHKVFLRGLQEVANIWEVSPSVWLVSELKPGGRAGKRAAHLLHDVFTVKHELELFSVKIKLYI